MLNLFSYIPRITKNSLQGISLYIGSHFVTSVYETIITYIVCQGVGYALSNSLGRKYPLIQFGLIIHI